jgi:hypothetical protein
LPVRERAKIGQQLFNGISLDQLWTGRLGRLYLRPLQEFRLCEARDVHICLLGALWRFIPCHTAALQHTALD